MKSPNVEYKFSAQSFGSTRDLQMNSRLKRLVQNVRMRMTLEKVIIGIKKAPVPVGTWRFLVADSGFEPL